MELSGSHGVQLILALLVGLVVFFAAFVVSPRKIFALLVITIPFQLVESRYGSLNMVMTYLVFFVFVLRGQIKVTPLLLSVIAIFFSYLLSTVLAPRATWFDHLLYIISVLSSFLMFYMAYNIFLKNADLRFALRLLIIMNGLCVLYALVLSTVGYGQLSVLGVEEWTLNQNLEKHQRLMGAFQAAGVTAAFYAFQMIFVIYAALFTEKGIMRYVCYASVLANFALIVASGSRGSFLTLIGGLLLLFFYLRPALGVVRTTRIALIGGACFMAMSVYVITQTDFNVLFERLSQTEVSESGVPDTRQIGFDLTFDRVDEALVAGHGPRIKLIDEGARRIIGYTPLGFYPHNLALFLVYSVGFIGLAAYVVFYCLLFGKIWRSKRNRHSVTAIRYAPILGLVFMVMFFVDQLKIEYLRFMFADFQQYVMFVLGTMLAFSRVAMARKPSKSNTNNEVM